MRLAPSEKYELFVEVLSGQATQRRRGRGNVTRAKALKRSRSVMQKL
jgi:hypothetical protein